MAIVSLGSIIAPVYAMPSGLSSLTGALGGVGGGGSSKRSVGAETGPAEGAGAE